MLLLEPDVDIGESCSTPPPGIFLADIIRNMTEISVPTILGYLCPAKYDHNFSEVQTLFGDEGSQVLSGLFFNEWFTDFRSIDYGKFSPYSVKAV
jgi:hypothetical protein